MMAGWLIVVIVLATIVGGVLVTLAIVTIVRDEAEGRAEASEVKRKRAEEDRGVDPFPLRLADEEPVWPEDDGELPELSEDDLYVLDKPKRSEDDF